MFDPAEHGLPVFTLGSWCWRGFQCRYVIAKGRLYLRELALGRDHRQPAGPVPLHGVSPRLKGPREIHRGAWHYQRLQVPVPFTGRLLLAYGSEHVGRLHMGFRPAWLYRTVYDTRFREGHLRLARNESQALARVRARLGSDGLGPAAGEASGEWIGRTFSLDYAYSWPALPLPLPVRGQ